MLWFLLKVLTLVSSAILIRGTLPRYRVDQLISLNWKIFIFIYVYFLLDLLMWIYLL